MVLAVAAGGAIGAGVNGVLIGRFGLSFFVVTLGTLVLYRGIVNIWSDSETEYVVSPFIDAIGFGTWLGIATPIWIMLGTFVVAGVLLRWTYFGRDVYAVGGNIDAARLSGITVARTIVLVYGIAGLCAALGGVVQVGRLGAASPLVGEDIPLQAAAAVLLGGTSFLGGVGGVVGTAVGVLFIGTLQNGLSIAGVSSFWQQVVTGIILIAAVAIDRVQRSPSGPAASRGRKRPRADLDRGTHERGRLELPGVAHFPGDALGEAGHRGQVERKRREHRSGVGYGADLRLEHQCGERLLYRVRRTRPFPLKLRHRYLVEVEPDSENVLEAGDGLALRERFWPPELDHPRPWPLPERGARCDLRDVTRSDPGDRAASAAEHGRASCGGVEPAEWREPDVHELAGTKHHLVQRSQLESLLDGTLRTLEWEVDRHRPERDEHEPWDASGLGRVHERDVPSCIDALDRVWPLVARERCRRRDDTRDAFQRPREGLRVLDVPRNNPHPSCLEPRARLSRGTRAHESAHTRPSLLQQGADPGPESTGRAGHEDFAHRSRFNIRGSAPRRALHRPDEAGHDRRR